MNQVYEDLLIELRDLPEFECACDPYIDFTSEGLKMPEEDKFEEVPLAIFDLTIDTDEMVVYGTMLKLGDCDTEPLTQEPYLSQCRQAARNFIEGIQPALDRHRIKIDASLREETSGKNINN